MDNTHERVLWKMGLRLVLLYHEAVYVFTNPFHSSDSCQLDDGATNMHKVGIKSQTNNMKNHFRHYSSSLRQPVVSSWAVYTTKPPIIDTTAAANRAMAAVEDVEVILGAAPVIDVVAYTRLKSKVELL